ncbi:unnamed protein product [Schistosoma mattheei]|uniref:Uncharacterized protein n=1 Tax=Schistosoma mattheei TaxID=31246 RepID=A0A183NPM3_9TREM|nr:unnamed protein product [Schistosoma mattheei]
MSEEQCSLVYNNVYQVIYGRMPPTQFQIEASTSTAVAMPLIQQTVVTNYEFNVDLDAALRNKEKEIVSINSEEFTEPDNDEHAYDNRL